MSLSKYVLSKVIHCAEPMCVFFNHQDESLLQYLSWQNCLLPFKLSKYVILQQKKVKLNKLGSISNSVWVYLDLQKVNELGLKILFYHLI